ncbi:MAG: Ni/Fe-hydrogenase cytochrome b subunit [Acidobacteria bacterium]|nr:Ni/Fe-hydrogenase cytochrome b subunit [Acidobacteriota bacterium]
MNTLRTYRFTFWRAVFGALLLAGAYATYLRFMYGLGAVTNLNDQFPWGIWIGFDILCGVGLAAGGFTLVATVHIFNIEKYKPVLRPAVLTAFLGYLLVIFALMFDLGRPDRIWHPLIMWNPRSVMFEVGWCVTLYTTVLFLEFTPAVFEKLRWHAPLRWFRMISVPLMIAGVILSTLHQSSLGSLFLLVPHKLDKLWYSSFLPLFFFISAIAVGMAMTIFESWHSSKAFGRQLEGPLLASLASVLAVVQSTYVAMRLADLQHRHAWSLLAESRIETWLFLLELGLITLPLALLFQARVRKNPRALYWAALMVIFGFITNRLNISVTGIERASGVSYVPKWTEVAVTLAIIGIGFGLFRLAAKHLPIFEEPDVHGEKVTPAKLRALRVA